MRDLLSSPSILRYGGIRKYLISFYKDTMLVFFVSLFYQNKEKYQTFICFVENFSFDEYPNPFLSQLLLKHFSIIEELVSFFDSNIKNLVDLQIMWDVHWVFSTKVLLVFSDGKKKIATGNSYSSDNDILKLFDDFSEDGCVLSSNYVAEGGVFMRDFLDYSNNFSINEEVESFYLALWLKSSFLLSLRAIDLHYENLLISANYPYFFDFECVFSPVINSETYSIVLSGILDDFLYWEKFGVIFWGRWDRKSLLTPILSDYWEDPTIKRTVPSKYKKLHIPESKNMSINPVDFKDFFLQGFNIMKEKILQDKSRLLNFVKNKPFLYNRIIFRPTRVYFALIKDAVMKFSIGKGDEVEGFLYEKLMLLPVFTQVEDVSILIKEEVKSLMCGLIPSFYSNVFDVGVWKDSWEIFVRLSTSCWSVFEEHVKGLEVFFDNAVRDIDMIYEQEKGL